MASAASTLAQMEASRADTSADAGTTRPPIRHRTQASGRGYVCAAVARLVVGIVIGAALGLGAGWVTFGDPFGNDPPGRADVEREVARVSGRGYASCNGRQYPTNVWDCTTPNDESSGEIGSCDFYVATVNDDRVAVERREPSGIDDTLRGC
jgi:hypothetical protein